MKAFLIMSLLLASVAQTQLLAQQETTVISGTVIDSETRRPMVFASVSIRNIVISIVTNGEGYFSLKFPSAYTNENVTVSYLGYHSTEIPVSQFMASAKPLTIALIQASLPIPMTTVRPLDALSIVRQAYENVRKNYSQEPMQMTGFYREMIKKGNTYVTLSEAVVDIHKAPYSPSFSVEQVGIYKGRGSIDRQRIDTVFVKFQGGIRSALEIDVVKNPFLGAILPEIEQYYDFTMEQPVQMNDKVHYVISFNQKPGEEGIYFRGRLFIEVRSLAIARVEFNMNVEGRDNAASMFIRKKPAGLKARVEYAAYMVQFREIPEGKWIFESSRTDIKFNAKWDKKLFRQNYTITSEMAVTEYSRQSYKIPQESRVKTTDITLYRVADFEDREFWEDYNIIEPESSIEQVISKIIRQLKKRSRE
jgi:hypothetical protein